MTIIIIVKNMILSARKLSKGFTLIELLVVIGILAILLSIVLIAINPARQFKQANNTNRSNAVLQLLNAVHQYAADNKGNIPSQITSTALNISNTGANICSLIMPTYIQALPTDPSLNSANIIDCTTYNTGYTIVKDANGRITVSAPSTEVPPATAIISITR